MATTVPPHHRNARPRPSSEKYLLYAAKKQKERAIKTKFYAKSIGNRTFSTQESSSCSESANSEVVKDTVVEATSQTGNTKTSPWKPDKLKKSREVMSQSSGRSKSDHIDLTDFSRKYSSFPPLDASLPTERYQDPTITRLSLIQSTEQSITKNVAREIVRKRSFSLADRYKTFPSVQAESVTVTCNDSEQSRVKSNVACRPAFNDSESKKTILSRDTLHHIAGPPIVFDNDHVLSSRSPHMPDESRDGPEEHVQFNKIIHRYSSRNGSSDAEKERSSRTLQRTLEDWGRAPNSNCQITKGASSDVQLMMESSKTEFRSRSSLSLLHDFSREVSCSIHQEHSKEKVNWVDIADIKCNEEVGAVSDFRSPVLAVELNGHVSSNLTSPARDTISGNNKSYSFAQFEKESMSKDKSISYDSGTNSRSYSRTHNNYGTYTHSYSRDDEKFSTKSFSKSQSSSNRNMSSTQNTVSYDSDADSYGEEDTNYFCCC